MEAGAVGVKMDGYIALKCISVLFLFSLVFAFLVWAILVLAKNNEVDDE